MPDWSVWALGLGVIALFALFFWHTGAMLVDFTRRLIGIIQGWPEIRRAMTEAEAQAGGRYPLWLRASRVVLILALVALCGLLLWRKLTGA